MSERMGLEDPETYQQCVDRIKTLTPASQPQWGKMDVAQMLAHCAEVQEVTNGKELKNTPFFIKLIKGLIRKVVLSQRSYPRNTGTHPQYEQRERRDFETERKHLLEALQSFFEGDEAAMEKIEHPLFGKMSRREKGWAMYKHLNHHLSQFGV